MKELIKTVIGAQGVRRYVLLGCVCIAIVVIGAGTIVFSAYRNSVENLTFSAASLSRTVSGYTERAFSSLLTLGRTVSDDYHRKFVPDKFREVLLDRVRSEPTVDAITILDASGRIVISTLSAAPGFVGADLSSSDIFRVPQNQKNIGLYISKPMKDFHGFPVRVSADRLLINVSVPIYKAGSSGNWGEAIFDGVIVLTLNDRLLHQYYKDLDLPADIAIIVLTTDGIVLARSDSIQGQIGFDRSSLLREVLGDKDEASVLKQSPVDNNWRFYNVVRVKEFPLVIVVGLPASTAFRSAAIVLTLVLGLLLVLLVAFIWLSRNLRADIGTRLQIEAQRIKLATEQKERELLHSIIRETNVLLLVIGEDRALISNSAAAESFLPEHIDQHDSQWMLQLFGKRYDEIMQDAPTSAEIRVRNKLGELRDVTWTLTAVNAGDQKSRLLIAFGLDTTEQKAAAASVHQAGKMVLLGELATGIAHELNQPLTTIGLINENLKTKLENNLVDQDQIIKTSDRVLKQVDRAAKIINHVLSLGRKSQIETGDVNLGGVINDALTITNPMLKLAGIDVRISGNLQITGAQAVSAQLEQVLINLIVNAKDAIGSAQAKNKTETNPAQISIDVSELPKLQQVRVSVEDTGIGLSPDVVDRVFEPFFTTKPVGKGTGLGLSLSYGIIKSFGGRMEARDTGKGARFDIYLQRRMK